MAETLLSIQEAADLVGKSVQTIRRALKSKKLVAKRQKTPQGFNYLIKEETLLEFYKEANTLRQHGGIQTSSGLKDAEQTSLVTEYATKEDLAEQKKMLDRLMDENRKDKETFTRFVKIFQERFTGLESQVKLLGEPVTNKRWYQFWK